MRNDKNLYQNINLYLKKFNDLYDLIKNKIINIKMIIDYDIEKEKIDKIKNDFLLENQLNNNDIEDEIEIILEEKIINNLELSFYDYLFFINNNGNHTYINILGFFILIKYFNEINELNNIFFPKNPNIELIDYFENFFSMSLAIERKYNNEDDDNDYINNSFISHYIAFKHSFSFELDYVLDNEHKEFIKNLVEPQIEIFEKRLIEYNINLMPLTIHFKLDDYIYFFRDIYCTNSKYLKILFFKNLNYIENTPILRMNYFNLFIRCVNQGHFLEVKKNNDNIDIYFYHDIPNKTIVETQLNDWIQKVKNEIFSLDIFVENFSKEIMTDFIENSYINIKTNSEVVKECVICMNETDKNEKNLYCNQCKNIFHNKCLNEWFKKSVDKTCPMCRKYMYTVYVPNYELYYTFYNLLLN